MKIAVLFGGVSRERDVSVASSSQIIRALRSNGHDVIAVDASRGILAPEEESKTLRETVDRSIPGEASAPEASLETVIAEIASAGFDLVFLGMHGGAGENGTVQALLQDAGVTFTGSDSAGSALAMSKEETKKRFRETGVPTPPWLMAPAPIAQVEAELGFPVIVKPSNEGSTVGLSLVKNPADFEAAVVLAAAFDDRVVLERYIPGRELTVGVLNDEAFAAGEIIPSTGEIFDYAAKYQADEVTEIFPADLSEEESARIRELALAAHRALGLSSYSRADFRCDSDGEFWCLEVNTLPGMTPNSLLPQSVGVFGLDFGQLCERICLNALSQDTDS